MDRRGDPLAERVAGDPVHRERQAVDEVLPAVRRGVQAAVGARREQIGGDQSVALSGDPDLHPQALSLREGRSIEADPRDAKRHG